MVLQPAQRITRNPPTPPMTIPSTPSPAPINQPDAATKAAEEIYYLWDCTQGGVGKDIFTRYSAQAIRRHLPDQSAEIAALNSSLAAVTKERDEYHAHTVEIQQELSFWRDGDRVTESSRAAFERADALAASFGKCQSELHALRTDNDTLAVENEKLRRILLRYLSSFDFAGGIATPINQLETLKVLLENEHLHPKA